MVNDLHDVNDVLNDNYTILLMIMLILPRFEWIMAVYTSPKFDMPLQLAVFQLGCMAAQKTTHTPEEKRADNLS